jgi:hypothetical protein
VVRDGVDYADVDLTDRVALVFGNEASGLAPDVLAALDVPVTIPMAGRAESLNVSVSAAVLCFEVLRQRRKVGPPEGQGGMRRGRESRDQGGGRTDPGAVGSTMPGMETRRVGETTDGGGSS